MDENNEIEPPAAMTLEYEQNRGPWLRIVRCMSLAGVIYSAANILVGFSSLDFLWYWMHRPLGVKFSAYMAIGFWSVVQMAAAGLLFEASLASLRLRKEARVRMVWTSLVMCATFIVGAGLSELNILASFSSLAGSGRSIHLAIYTIRMLVTSINSAFLPALLSIVFTRPEARDLFGQ